MFKNEIVFYLVLFFPHLPLHIHDRYTISRIERSYIKIYAVYINPFSKLFYFLRKINKF